MEIFSVTEEMWLALRFEIRSLECSIGSRTVTWYSRSTIPESNLKAEVICGIYVADTEESLGTPRNSRGKELEYYKELVAVERAFFESLLEELPEHKARLNIDRDVIFEILKPVGWSPDRTCYFQGGEVFWDE